MSKRDALLEGLNQHNRKELIDFSMAQHDMYNDLLNGYEEANELLMKSGIHLHEIIIFLGAHLPADNEKRKKTRGVLLKFFNSLQKNESIRRHNNLNSKNSRP